MLKNYFKTAVRTLLRNKSYASINILGLALGMCCALILFLLASYVNSYDDFQENKDRIYRLVNSSLGQGDEKDYTPGVPVPLPEAVRIDFPEFEKVVFTRNHHGEMHFTINPDSNIPNYFELNEERLVYTEPQYLEIFTVNWLAGNRGKALDNPNSIVLSESIAKQFFPYGEVLGKTIVLNKETQLQVTGVISNPPDNTDMPFSMLVSLSTIADDIKDSGWNSVSSDDQCYLLASTPIDTTKYSARLAEFAGKYFEDQEDRPRKLQLQSMEDLHSNEFYSNYSYKTVSNAQVKIIYIIGIFLIITACINFINLSTAVAIKRSREVGVRKVLGSTRKQLVVQFLFESFAIILISSLVALGLAELLLLYVNPFMEIQLDIPWFTMDFFIYLTTVLVSITLLSGFYPALVLSGFRPAIALKKVSTSKGSGSLGLRKGLVVFQFFISQVFIIGTIIIISQLEYIKNADLGFSTNALLNVRIPEDDLLKKHTLKTELSKQAGVEKVSLLYSNPSSGSVSISNFRVEGDPEEYYTAMKFVDEDYLDIYDIEVLAGRALRQSDTLREVVVNEKLLRYVGFEGTLKDAIGKQVRVWGENVPIVGVIRDLHSTSLHQEIMTMMLFNHSQAYRLATIKVDMKGFESTLPKIKETWLSIYPEYEFEHTFIDEHVAQFYEGERKMSIFISVAAGFAIFIGCLGLFGLASFMVSQKVKEIGVRKVLGASVGSIIYLFSKTYLLLIALAFVLAAPVAWYTMKEWLANFQYRITIGPMFFILALAFTLIIAIMTVGYKSFKAACTNPVDSLRSE